MDTISGPNSLTRQFQSVSGIPRSLHSAATISSTSVAATTAFPAGKTQWMAPNSLQARSVFSFIPPFPLIGELEALLKEAVVKATFEAPLRHNSVETFDEYNTGKNVGKGTPTVFWDIVPDSDQCEIYTYMAGGGCTLPGKAMVLMPGEGYEGVTKFVLDVMTSYGINACPPLLVGVGVATSVETAALLSKKALMRPIGSHNDNERAAKMERLLEDGINAIGLGPQGMGGKYSVMGVNIENTARHPSTIGVAVNVGCWSHRRGHIIFDKDLNYTITTHSGVEL